jgi:hypothetical protein
MCGRVARLSVELDTDHSTKEAKLRYQIAVAAAATGIAAAGLAGGGGAGAEAQDGQQTLRLVSVEQRCASADNGRRGESLGDLGVCRGVLRQAGGGAAAGRAHWTCVYLGSTRAGSDCSAVVTLSGGTLQAAGVLSHTSRTSTWAITGGTGEHAGARGSVRLEQRSATRTLATITLLP